MFMFCIIRWNGEMNCKGFNTPASPFLYLYLFCVYLESGAPLFSVRFSLSLSLPPYFFVLCVRVFVIIQWTVAFILSIYLSLSISLCHSFIRPCQFTTNTCVFRVTGFSCLVLCICERVLLTRRHLLKQWCHYAQNIKEIGKSMGAYCRQRKEFFNANGAWISVVYWSIVTNFS